MLCSMMARRYETMTFSPLMFIPSPSEVLEVVVILTGHLFGVHASPLRHRIVLVEIAGISRMAQFGDDWASGSAVVKCFPVDGGEERV